MTCNIRFCFCSTALLLLVALPPVSLAAAAESGAAAARGDSMTYRQAKEFLAKHTKVVELTDGAARVLICPEYQGRVMTSTCSGEDGASLGWINRRFIEEGKPSRQFNNYGGEDRIWLSPEGGPIQPLVCSGRETGTRELVHPAGAQ